ncbi:D-amino peptidase [Paenibacillus uliginis N3/975]|uniref:D-amino peptidase n=1 Tax=Paenibacillus uliginis N3/975 TaxID=1313296 RepID=A0A1X7HT87_9BACL|nr:M55 family metallopeptidase [Paenibacillus uliginis]SMF91908.1 D-amino peptidase [Paenibacillus uliginis N3/975]
MKIYVCVDMEGIAGIVLPSQLRQGESFYQEGRHLMTEEVNAVVDGLLEAGATEVIVRDMHASGFNLLIDQLHPDASYFMGASKIEDRFPGIDSSFHGAILLGYHAMAGTKHAVRDHTFSSMTFIGMELNGQPIGEIGIDSLLLGLHQVPVLLVTGDDKTCQEAEQILPHTTTYQTKTAWGRHSALMKSPRKVNMEIKEAVKQALFNQAQCLPYSSTGPYELKVQYMSTDLADAVQTDGIHQVRLDGLTIVYKDTNLVSLFSKAL